MQIDVPIQVVPDLFFSIGVIEEKDRNILLLHLDHDNSVGFNNHLAALGFGLPDETPRVSCKGSTYSLDLPEGLIAKLSVIKNEDPKCKSIWYGDSDHEY